jgi:DNA-binding NarL/FixJ family response regulator
MSAFADSPKIRVLIVDDHVVAREGLRAIISSESDMEVAGEATNFDEAVTAFAGSGPDATLPDVTLMDIRLPGRSGIEAIQSIRSTSPQSRFIVLTSHDGDELIHKALLAGVQAYLYKDMVRNELTTAIRAVHSGRKYIPVEVSSRLFEFSASSQVTARELDVLRLIASGLANKQIAHELDVTEYTVKSHVQSILSKLGASDRTHAVTIALKRGLLFL